ncbi:Crp/Fnr family transcriptional regulator [Chryseotalea sanaruensis]|uniref:Crp/Fnr family transcriptional regulator n=2 Tax=Chryseotalea sanaruensis TaxID=2482724 RepID=A0A401UD42_9BACT|nr:Crp/Fnr family transcriptional regulator [Chryseotalea sanaruensis]
MNMNNALKKFITKYVILPDAELENICNKFKCKTLKKNSYLLRQGDICKDLVFVQKGCLRLYYLKDDVEVSVWFAFEQSSAIEIYSFISEEPTNYFIQAIEDSEVLYLSKAELNRLYQLQPKMQEMMRKFWEDVILNLINRFTALQTDSAEKRYFDLLSKPEYMDTIPQKYLASFIGVTPTSLSRIRKQIMKND